MCCRGPNIIVRAIPKPRSDHVLETNIAFFHIDQEGNNNFDKAQQSLGWEQHFFASNAIDSRDKCTSLLGIRNPQVLTARDFISAKGSLQKGREWAPCKENQLMLSSPERSIWIFLLCVAWPHELLHPCLWCVNRPYRRGGLIRISLLRLHSYSYLPTRTN